MRLLFRAHLEIFVCTYLVLKKWTGLAPVKQARPNVTHRARGGSSGNPTKSFEGLKLECGFEPDFLTPLKYSSVRELKTILADYRVGGLLTLLDTHTLLSTCHKS
jgi:hypothetical protein